MPRDFAHLQIAGLALALACTSRTPAPAPLASAEFVASSLANDSFALVGEFRGHYTIYNDSILLTDVRAVILLRDSAHYGSTRRLTGIRAGLAFALHGRPPYTWDWGAQSWPVSVKRTLNPGDRFTLDSLRFALPTDLVRDLHARWLVFEFRQDFPDAPRGTPRWSTSYAHSDHAIFSGVPQR